MAIGRHILTTGQLVVNHAVFTWTTATPYHLYNAWIAEILLYLLYAKLGSIGLLAFRYFVHGSFLALAIYFAIRRRVWINPLAWVIITIGIVLSFYALFIQPEVFSFVFMFITVFIYFIIRDIGIRAWAWCYLFPVITLLWVNSHGAFVLGVIFFLFVGSGELLNTWIGSP